MNILDSYVMAMPSPQNILDIFKGEWSSKLPEKYGLSTTPGFAELFEDERVMWAEKVFGHFKDWSILELGPLEGGHSYMFQNMGANDITAIEANTRSFLKCLCIKEILGLDKVHFQLGDFMAFLEEQPKVYDLVFASGVIYHMEEPVQLIERISKITNRVFIWTHFYDGNTINKRDDLRPKFGQICKLNYKNVNYEYVTQAYQQALSWSGFCGGSEPTSKWLTRSSLLQCLKNFGFDEIKINFETLDHPHGPSLAICAINNTWA